MNSLKLLITAFVVAFFLNSSIVLSSHAEGEKLLRAAIAVDTETKPTDSFTSDVPKLYAFYIGMALKKGDKLRGVWIAEDVGTAAPKNTQIDEAVITVETATDQGAFSLSKPTNGWPIGKYKIEIYVGEKLAETVKFKILAEAEGEDAEAEEGDEQEE